MAEAIETTIEKRRTGRIALVWIGIIALACLVYAAGMGHESICYDEMVVNAIAAHRPTEIVALMRFDNHPPLFYLLVWAVRALLGSSEWALRSVSVMAAVGLVALGAGPVRRLLGDRVAFLYAGVVLFTPAILIYAHEARMYTPATVTVTAAALYGALAVRDGRAGDWVKLGVSSLAAAYLHYYALIAVFSANAFVLGWVLLRRHERLWRAMTTSGLMAVAYLPWVAVVVRQSRSVHDAGFWVSPVSPQAVWLALLRPFTYKEVVPGVRQWMVAALVLWVLLIAVGAVLAWIRPARGEGAVAGLMLVVYLGTMAATVGISLAYVPVFFFRYMIVGTGVLAVLVSMGAGRLPGRWLPGVAVGVLALLNAATLRDVYTRHFNYGMKRVAQDLGTLVQPGDLIVTTESFSLGPALYYFPQAEIYYSDNPYEERWGQILNVLVPPLHYKTGLGELLATRKSFWNITCSIGLGRDMAEVLGDEPGWEEVDERKTYREPFSWCSYTVAKYAHSGKEGGAKSTLKVHLTGIKPGGGLVVELYDHGPFGSTGVPVRFEIRRADRPELTVLLSGLDRKDYALIVWQDQNDNQRFDLDGQGIPTEGFFVYNQGKMADDVGTGATPLPLSFDAIKLPLVGASRTIEARIQYVPPRSPPTPKREGKGSLKLHVTGLRQGGVLDVFLFDQDPLDMSRFPYRALRQPVSGEDMLVPVEHLPHGDYALVVTHDLNPSDHIDFDQGRPFEGYRVLNIEKVEPGRKGPPPFDAVKFPFMEAEKIIEMKMAYPKSSYRRP